MEKPKKNQTKGSWGKALLLAGLIYVGATIIKNEYPILIDPFFNVPSEKKLQESINTNVCFELMSKKEAEERAFYLDKSFDTIRQNWNNFDRQIALVDNIILRRGFLGNRGDMTLYRNDMYLRSFNGGLIVHELAHKWHERLENRNDFDKKWIEISGGKYMGDYRSANDIQHNENGSTFRYSIKNIREDVAETTRLIYLLNDPETYVREFPNKKVTNQDEAIWMSVFQYNPSKEAIKKVGKKVTLLEDYDFFSAREYNYAIEELNNFNRN